MHFTTVCLLHWDPWSGGSDVPPLVRRGEKACIMYIWGVGCPGDKMLAKWHEDRSRIAIVSRV